MTTTRFAVVSTAPFSATFRTVRSLRTANLFARWYTFLGYSDIYGARLTFSIVDVAR